MLVVVHSFSVFQLATPEILYTTPTPAVQYNAHRAAAAAKQPRKQPKMYKSFLNYWASEYFVVYLFFIFRVQTKAHTEKRISPGSPQLLSRLLSTTCSKWKETDLPIGYSCKSVEWHTLGDDTTLGSPGANTIQFTSSGCVKVKEDCVR